MLIKSIPIVITSILLSGAVTSANADSITYDIFAHSGSDHIDYKVVIDDNATGKFTITYQVQATSPNQVGKLTGFFFDMGSIDTGTLPDPDTSDPYTAANLGLSNESNASGSSICGSSFGDTKSVSGGCNSTLNMGTLIIDGFDYSGFLFDVGLAWKVNDLTSGDTGTFSIADLGLSLDDWGAIGLRGQATGSGSNGGNGSAKEFQLVGTKDPNDPNTGNDPIPEPSTLVLLAMGLLGFFNASRKKV